MREPVLRVLFTADQIQARVKALALEIDARYTESADLVLVGVLRGATYLLSDMSRSIKTPHRIDFVEYASYRGTAKGEGTLLKGCTDSVAGADVILVDEIADTGGTLRALQAYLAAGLPRSVAVCVLFTRRVQPEENQVEDSTDNGEDRQPVAPDFRGFEVGTEFLVGYGLDLNQRLRHLPYVGVVDSR